MTKDEALKLALKFVEDSECGTADLEAHIREALAQSEQEPVAFASHGVVNWIADKQFQHEAFLYSAPQRTWVGLTNKEIEAIWEVAMFANYGVGAELSNQPFVHYAKAIEAKLRSKND